MSSAPLSQQAERKTITTERLLTLLTLVNNEVLRSYHLFPTPLHNPHEAYGVLAEEFDEFFEFVKIKDGTRDYSLMTGELVQLAAMALRTILDLSPEEQRRVQS